MTLQRLKQRNGNMTRLWPSPFGAAITVCLIVIPFGGHVVAEKDRPSSDTSVARAEVVPPARRPWAFFYYHSLMTDNSIWQVLAVRDLDFRYGSLNSFDLSYELPHDNAFRGFWQRVVSTIDVAANVTQRNDSQGSSLEVASYVMWRWRHLPLQRYLVSTIAVGEGVSYVTSVPMREQQGAGKHLLNFIAAEATFGLPSRRAVEVVGRIHHRSPAWGLFGDSTSSNAVGLGIRYRF